MFLSPDLLHGVGGGGGGDGNWRGEAQFLHGASEALTGTWKAYVSECHACQYIFSLL